MTGVGKPLIWNKEMLRSIYLFTTVCQIVENWESLWCQLCHNWWCTAGWGIGSALRCIGGPRTPEQTPYRWWREPGDTRDHLVFASSQWETTLQCDVVSHWLGAYTKWSLDICIALAIYRYSVVPRQLGWFYPKSSPTRQIWRIW